jgi:hypothetical protein
VANSIAVKNFYPHGRVAIELGGQDAKVIFFRYHKESTASKEPRRSHYHSQTVENAVPTWSLLSAREEDISG